jgi:hypothetical protein
VGNTLQATEAFDYQERLYTAEAIRTLVAQAGLHTMTLTKAYARHTAPSPDDGIVVVCRI